MKPWKVIFTDAALADVDAILETTLESFGTGRRSPAKLRAAPFLKP